jgi:hypothetical protein
MSIATILGAVLWLGAAQPIDTSDIQPVALHQETNVADMTGVGRAVRLSASEGQALIARLVSDAQACIVQRVGDDPEFRDAMRGGRVGDLIVAAFRPCWPAVDALITAHDQQFGSGSGESFVTGPFLDRIPRIIEDRLR